MRKLAPRTAPPRVYQLNPPDLYQRVARFWRLVLSHRQPAVRQLGGQAEYSWRFVAPCPCGAVRHIDAALCIDAAERKS